MQKQEGSLMRRILSSLCSLTLLFWHFQVFAVENQGAEADSARLERERAQTAAVSNNVLATLLAKEEEERKSLDIPETEEELASDYSLQMVAEQVEMCKEKNGGWKKGTVQLPKEPEPFDCSQLALLEYEILKQQAGDDLKGESAALMCATRGWHIEDKMDFAKQLENMGKLKHGLDEHFSCPSKNESNLECVKNMGCNVLRSGMAVATVGVSKVMEVFGVPLPFCKQQATKTDCLTEVIWGVWKDLVSNVEGIWDIAKMGWSAVKGIASKAWGWVSSWFGSSSPAEDATSIKQAFLENQPESFFSKFLKNPLGAFTDMVSKFMSSMGSFVGDAIQDNFGCAEWEDNRLTSPIHPKCAKPVVSFKCASCEQKLNMACGVAGFLGGEVLLSFLTGGVVNGAAKLGKTAKGAAIANKLKVGGQFATRWKGVDIAMKGFGVSKRAALGLMTRGGNIAVKVGGKLYKMAPRSSELMLKVLRGGKAALSAAAYPVKKYADLMEEAFVFGASGMSREAVAQLRVARLASRSQEGIRAAKTAGMSEAAVSKFDDVAKAAEDLKKAREQLLAAARNGKANEASKATLQAAKKGIDDATERMIAARKALAQQVKVDDIAKGQQIARAREAEAKAREAEKQRLIAEQKAKDLEIANQKIKAAEAQKTADAAEAQRKLKLAEDQARKQRDLAQAQKKADEAAEASRKANEVAAAERAQLEATRAEQSRKRLLASQKSDVPEVKAPKGDDVVDGVSLTKVDDAADISLTTKVDDATSGTLTATSKPVAKPAAKPVVKPSEVIPEKLGAKGDQIEVVVKGSSEPLKGKIIDSGPNGITIKQADGVEVSIPARNIDGAKTKNLFETSNIPGLNIAKPGDNVVLTTAKGEKLTGQLERVNDKSIRLITGDGTSINVRTRDLDLDSVKLTRNGQDPMGQALKAADTGTDVGQVNAAASKKDDIGTIIDDMDGTVAASSNLPVLYKAPEVAKLDDGARLMTNVADDVAERLGPYSVLNNRKVDLVDPKTGNRIKNATLERAERLPDGGYIHHYRTADGAEVSVNLSKEDLIMDLSKLGKGEVHYISPKSTQAQRALQEGKISELQMSRVIEHEGVPVRINGNRAVARFDDVRASNQSHVLLLEDGRKLEGKILSYRNGLIEMRLANGKIIKFPFPRKLVMLGKAGQLVELVLNTSEESSTRDRFANSPRVGDAAGPAVVATPSVTPTPGTDPARDPAASVDPDLTEADLGSTVNSYKLDPSKGGKLIQFKAPFIIPPPEGFSGIIRGIN